MKEYMIEYRQKHPTNKNNKNNKNNQVIQHKIKEPKTNLPTKNRYTKYICECAIEILHNNLHRHLKSNFHLEWIKNNIT